MIQDKYSQPFDLFIVGDFNSDYMNNRALGIWYGNKPSTIDYILTNSDCVREHGVKHINVRDHELIYVVRKKLKIQYNAINTFERSYKIYDTLAFQQALTDHDWSMLNDMNNPEEYWNTLLDGITDEIEKLCPLKRMVLKDYRDPWISREIVKKLKDKKRLFLKVKRSKLSEDLKLAREARNRANRLVKQAKEDYIKENL